MLLEYSFLCSQFNVVVKTARQELKSLPFLEVLHVGESTDLDIAQTDALDKKCMPVRSMFLHIGKYC